MNISNNNGLNLSFNGYVSPSTNKLIRQAALSELRVLVNDANNKGVAVDVSMLNNIKNRRRKYDYKSNIRKTLGQLY